MAETAFMAEALRLAALGYETVSPNPLVGAVVVRRGEIVGRGYHARFGGPHAEVEALAAAGAKARGADLYVTLEPCAHHGKTPPCTDAILRAGIARVVYACPDPNPLTRGQGPRRLRSAGVRVESGLLRPEAERLNAPYLHFHRTGRPWVILKWAMTLDGKIAAATGKSRWITGPAARAEAHRLRRRVDAVLAGTRTLVLDDPLLTPRPAKGRHPLRVILDRRGIVPLSARILSPEKIAGRGPRLYVTSKHAPRGRLGELERRGIEVLRMPAPGGRFELTRLVEELGSRGVTQLLVEGGGRLAGAFFDADLACEAAVFTAPLLLGGREAPGPLGGRGRDEPGRGVRLYALEERKLGPDFYLRGHLQR